jgi:hypothetical protein
MKIVSLNAELTKSATELAFNLDEEMTPLVKAYLEYGVLELDYSGDVLFVKVPEDSAEAFTAANIITLNEKLAAAKDIIDQYERSQRSKLEGLAEKFNLPLA